MQHDAIDDHMPGGAQPTNADTTQRNSRAQTQRSAQQRGIHSRRCDAERFPSWPAMHSGSGLPAERRPPVATNNDASEDATGGDPVLASGGALPPHVECSSASHSRALTSRLSRTPPPPPPPPPLEPRETRRSLPRMPPYALVIPRSSSLALTLVPWPLHPDFLCTCAPLDLYWSRSWRVADQSECGHVGWDGLGVWLRGESPRS